MPSPTHPRILILAHAPVDGAPSGLPVHLNDLIAELPDQPFGVCYPEQNHLRLDLFRKGAKTAYAWPLPETRVPPGRSREVSPFLEEDADTAILETVLDIVRPTLVHVHHLLGHSRSIYRVVRSFGLPLAQTLHDFYSVTPHIHLQTLPSPEEIARQKATTEGHKWLRGMEELLQAADALSAPSPFVWEAVSRFLALPRERCGVVEPGLPAALLKRRVRRKGRASGAQALRVGVLGALKLDRGWIELLRWAPEGTEFHYFGHVPFELPAHGSAPARLHGAYRREEIVDLLAGPELDLAVLPTPFVETYSLALSEAWCAGLPVLAPNQGAPALRLAQGGGWVYPPHDWRALGERLRELSGHPLELAEAMGFVAQQRLASTSDSAQGYQELWARAIQRQGAGKGASPA